MNLSRRSLLTGLLSSAAVIAAGPVAKIVPVAPKPVSLADVGNRFESYSSHFRWNKTVIGEDWRYVARLANIGGNVLEGGRDDPRTLDWKMHWAKQA